MIEILNFDRWEKYEGLSEGSGRSEKVWLQSPDGRIGLFKFPKVDEKGNISSTEYISEHLASRLGKVLGVPVADVDIGYRNSRIGCMSYLISSDIEEGINYISRKYPMFDSNRLEVPGEGLYYCLDMIKSAMEGVLPSDWFVPMMVFDYLIGNSDRHQSNWAIINDNTGGKQLCPLYDNGSSLCSFVREEDLGSMKSDKLRFEALVRSKSRSCIRVDGKDKKMPTHENVIYHLLSNNTYARTYVVGFIERLKDIDIREMLGEYPSDILSDEKKELIVSFLREKHMRLNQILMEESHGKG